MKYDFDELHAQWGAEAQDACPFVHTTGAWSGCPEYCSWCEGYMTACELASELYFLSAAGLVEKIRCTCSCHRIPGTKHVAACCDAPPAQAEGLQ